MSCSIFFVVFVFADYKICYVFTFFHWFQKVIKCPSSVEYLSHFYVKYIYIYIYFSPTGMTDSLPTTVNSSQYAQWNTKMGVVLRGGAATTQRPFSHTIFGVSGDLVMLGVRRLVAACCDRRKFWDRFHNEFFFFSVDHKCDFVPLRVVIDDVRDMHKYENFVLQVQVGFFVVVLFSC